MENNMEWFYLNEVYGVTQWVVYSFLVVKYSGISICLNIIEGFSYFYRVAYKIHLIKHDSSEEKWVGRSSRKLEIPSNFIYIYTQIYMCVCV